MSIEQRIEHITNTPDPNEQLSRLQEYVNDLINTRNAATVRQLIAKLFSATLIGINAQTLRSISVFISQQLLRLHVTKDPSFEELACFYVMQLKQQGGGLYDEADYIIRSEGLFHYYVGQNLFKDASLILAGINFESTSYAISNNDKANMYLMCAECCLEDDESVDAEVFVNRASAFMNEINDKQIQLRFRATSARVLDSNRKFLEAADRYFELSSAADTGICEEDLNELLGKAITCAILAKAGPRRSRILKQLSKDEKLVKLEQMPRYSSHTIILSKMTQDHLLSRDEFKTFQGSLLPHQKAMTSDGFTIPEKAMIEHNLVAVAKLYDNILISELSVLIGLEPHRIEKIVAKMIAEDRLRATIDQTIDMLQFESETVISSDIRIKEICDNITACVERIEAGDIAA